VEVRSRALGTHLFSDGPLLFNPDGTWGMSGVEADTIILTALDLIDMG